MNRQLFCPLCLSSLSKNKFLASSKTYSNAISIESVVNECGKCSAYYLEDFVDESLIGNYYPVSYYTKITTNIIDNSSLKYRIRLLSYSMFKGYPTKNKVTPVLFFASLLYGVVFWHRWSRFPKYVKTDIPLKVLEIGYGAGGFLIDLNALGWECAGFDIEQSNAEALIKLGISVAPSYEALSCEKNNIDYLYSYHAFEHIYDIDKAMENSYEILAKNGIFKLCVPVSDGLLPKLFKKYWYDLGVPIHKQIFSKVGIHLLAKRHGFEVKHCKYNSYSQSFIGSIFALMIGKLKITDHAAQDFAITKFFKIMCLLISPVVFCLDLLHLGDRIEVVLVKK